MLTNIKLFCRQKLIDGSGTLKSREHLVSFRLSGAMRRKFHSSVIIWTNKNTAWQYWLPHCIVIGWKIRTYEKDEIFTPSNNSLPESWKKTKWYRLYWWRIPLEADYFTFWVSMFKLKLIWFNLIAGRLSCLRFWCWYNQRSWNKIGISKTVWPR